jgi:hypothetical protein
LLALTLTTIVQAQPVFPTAIPPSPATGREIVVSFRGQIDGSDRIEIIPTHAYWVHSNFDLPEKAITLNGISWDPRASRVLANEGETRFLREEVDFRSARLKHVRGRDTVVLEPRRDSVVIAISDTPNGSALYEFDVAFRPRPKRASLHIVAEIDGSDQLRIDSRGARWVHRQWEPPKEVRLNDVTWYPQDPPYLKNEGPTKFLDGSVDFSTARLTIHSARDLVQLEPTGTGLTLHFADNPLGAATYDVTISFDE